MIPFVIYKLDVFLWASKCLKAYKINLYSEDWNVEDRIRRKWGGVDTQFELLKVIALLRYIIFCVP